MEKRSGSDNQNAKRQRPDDSRTKAAVSFLRCSPEAQLHEQHAAESHQSIEKKSGEETETKFERN